MKIFVLIQAGEGTTESVFVCGCGCSKENFIDLIFIGYNKYIEEMSASYKENNQGYMEEKRNALIEMLKQHPSWDVGEYILENIEPEWQEWTLIVADGQFCSIG